MAEIIQTGKTNKDVKLKKDKIYKIPYHDSDKLKYCREATHSGQHILLVRTPNNQGDTIIVTGDFSASGDMIIIKLSEEYERYYRDVLVALEENFDYKALIKESPVKVKNADGVWQTTKNIGISHVKNFIVAVEE
jgi:hypothetical protein